jgi:hypothetical protein
MYGRLADLLLVVHQEPHGVALQVGSMVTISQVHHIDDVLQGDVLQLIYGNAIYQVLLADVFQPRQHVLIGQSKQLIDNALVQLHVVSIDELQKS